MTHPHRPFSFRTRDLRQRAARWLDGQIHVVRPGVEVPAGILPKNIQAAVYKAAEIKGGGSARTRKTKPGEIIEIEGNVFVSDGTYVVVLWEPSVPDVVDVTDTGQSGDDQVREASA